MKTALSKFVSRFNTALVSKLSRRAWRLAPEAGMRGSAAILALFALFGFNPQALAATDTWVGNSATSDFNTAGDWAAAAVPTSGDALVFTSTNNSTTTTLTDDLSGYTFGAITFNYGAPAYTINGDSFTMNAGMVNSSGNTQTINDAIIFTASHSFTTDNYGGNITLSGGITGTGFGISTQGGGTVTLQTTANGYTGGTTVGYGTLLENFGSLTSGLINSSSALTMSGGTLSILGNPSSTTSQTFASTAISAGASVISATSAGTIPVVDLNAFTTTTGASIVFNGPATINASGNVPAYATIETTTAGLTPAATPFGLLTTSANSNPYATVGLYDWASTDVAAGTAGTSPYTIIGGSQVTGFYTALAPGNTSAGGATNVDLTGQATSLGFGSTSVVRISGNVTVDTIRMNNERNPYITIKSGDVLISGGLLVTPNMGTVNAGVDSLRQVSGNNIQIVQNNTSGVLVLGVDSFADFTTGNNAGDVVVYSGAGTTFLNPISGTHIAFNYENSSNAIASSSSIYYDSAQENDPDIGTQYINGGTIAINTGADLSNPSSMSSSAGGVGTLNLNGGTIIGVLNSINLTDLAGANRNIFLGSGGGGLASEGGGSVTTVGQVPTTMTVAGLISTVTGAGPLVIGIPASSANGNTIGLVPGTGGSTANPAYYANGTVVLSDVSNAYTGGTVLDSGTLQLTGTMGELGAGGVTLNGGSFQWGASTSTDISTRSVTFLSNSILDTGANNVSLANPVGNNGTGGFTKLGTGNLTLASANPFSGNVNINAGTLTATNTAGSATGSGSVAINSGGTLSGPGFVTGAVTVNSGGSITPGTVTSGDAGSGQLTIGNLTLSSGASLNFGLSSSVITEDTLSLGNSGAGTLTLNSGITLNLYVPDTTTSFATAGTYDLIATSSSYTPTQLGSDITIGTPDSGYIATYAISGGYLQLTLTANGTIGTWTNGGATGNWSLASNWSGTGTLPPSAPGDSATFGATAPGVVNLDTSETVGAMIFDNSSAFTISGANTLTLDNKGAGATITDELGAHTILTAVTLNDNLGIATSAGTQLTISGNIGQTVNGPFTLTKTGAGTLVLGGVNSYTGATTVSAGTLNFNSLSALGSGTVLNLGGASSNGTLQWATGTSTDVSGLTVNIAAGGATFDTNANNVSFANPIGGTATGGGLTKVGNGSLSLASGDTYTGVTTIDGGALSIASNSALGAAATGAGLVLNSGTLTSTASVALNNGGAGTNDRAISLGTGGGTLNPSSSTILTVSGAITGGNQLTVTGGGQVTILNATSGQNSFSGGTVINDGSTVFLGDGNSNVNGLGSGTVTLDNGTLNLLYTTNNATQNGIFANNLKVDFGDTGTLIATDRGDISGNLTGSGTLDLETNFSRGNIDGSWNAFTGLINVTGNDFRLNSTNSFTNATIDLGTGVNMYIVLNYAAGTANISVGSLDGAAGSTLSAQNSTNSGRVGTYLVGGLNTTGTFAGQIIDESVSSADQPTAITKQGTQAWILTGTNTYSGATTITSGTLQIGNGGNTGTLGGGGTDAATASAVTNNAALVFDRSDTAYSVPNTITGSGTTTITGGGTIAFTAGNSYTGGTVINDASTLNINGINALGGAVYTGLTLNGGTLQYASALTSSGDISEQAGGGAAENVTFSGNATFDTNGNNVTFAKTIGNGGPGGLIVADTAGTGSLTLDAAETYTGQTTINAGATLDLGDGTAGHDGTIAASSGITDNGNLVYNRASAESTALVINGGGNVTVAGPGSQTLSASSGYTGSTTVSSGGTMIVSGSIAGTTVITVAGTLEVDGSTNGATPIALRAGSTLLGVGYIGGASDSGDDTDVEAGDSAGSTAVGTLTSIGGISLGGSSTLSFRLGLNSTTDADQLVMAGSSTLTLDNSLLQVLVGDSGNTTAAIDNLYVIVNGGAGSTSGADSDSFSDAPFNGTNYVYTNPSGFVFNVFYATDPANDGSPGDDIDVQLVSVPEPGTWASLLGGLGVLMTWQRSRRRRS